MQNGNEEQNQHNSDENSSSNSYLTILVILAIISIVKCSMAFSSHKKEKERQAAFKNSDIFLELKVNHCLSRYPDDFFQAQQCVKDSTLFTPRK